MAYIPTPRRTTLLVRELEEDKNKLQSDILSFQQQKQRLAEQLNALDRQIADAENETENVDMDIEDALELPELVRKLALAMYTKLPREIRDMVYEYACVEEYAVWSEDTPSSIHYALNERHTTINQLNRYGDWSLAKFKRYGDTRWDAISGTPLDPYSMQDRETNFFLDPEFVGREVAVEAAEVYYSRNKFHISTHQDLPFFLRYDPFNSRFAPFHFVRSLIVDIHCEDLTRDLCCSSGKDFNEEKRILNAYFAPLERAFALLKGGRRLEVHININTCFEEDCGSYRIEHVAPVEHQRHFLNILEALRKPVYELKHAGCNVTLRHCDVFEETTVRHLFQLSAEDWQQEKETQLRSRVGMLNAHYISRDMLNANPRRLRSILKKRWGVTRLLDWVGEYGYEYHEDDSEDASEEGQWATEDEGEMRRSPVASSVPTKRGREEYEVVGDDAWKDDSDYFSDEASPTKVARVGGLLSPALCVRLRQIEA